MKAGALTATSAFGAAALPALNAPAPGTERVLRIGHLTDIHVQPERKAAEGMAKAFEIVNGLSDKPDLILTGGDLIMDAFGQSKDRVKTQWDIFTRVLRDSNDLPVRHCLGNHDFWNGAGGQGKEDPMFGHRWAQDALELEKPYYDFEQAGWKFVVLQSTLPEGGGYKGRLDEEQFEWLTGVLQGTPKTMPVLVLSHIPILSASTFFDGDNEKSGNWQVPGAWMHIDARRIKDLFHKHPNVKVCVSGHVHLVDRTDYLGVSYVCNGAVCGGWWGGNYQETAPGYTVIDLYADGTFRNDYTETGWEAQS
ncbi:MAG TPA: metallophosphoesterase [Armatimonadetes bacterium]|mgnify:CR=1 FL=1|nr:metallophosphoesterase [Armatimonadota bacterium]HCM73879.1 metallophosphoesterase [Armatimonadota bacterium]